ncbi:uncharacterized protein ARMOST_02270 [Armillaria ostoyae]|uniref:Mug135-like C-terminal domain-containing protein n=1 Tax=Armillaria ostoyae TaxID=47428 RepID=A0A284QR82_ARMOS|nr:uncharacterized protein ARMOST_02270 [Armillaria ostoyae]
MAQRIEERLERIDENDKNIGSKIGDLDSRFDDVDSKLEDIDMEVLTDSIDEAIKESLSLDESLAFESVERMAAMNHNTNIYHPVKDKGKPVPSSNSILAEVPFPGGEKPTSRSLPLLKDTAVIDSLSDNKLARHYESIILEKLYRRIGISASRLFGMCHTKIQSRLRLSCRLQSSLI